MWGVSIATSSPKGKQTDSWLHVIKKCGIWNNTLNCVTMTIMILALLTVLNEAALCGLMIPCSRWTLSLCSTYYDLDVLRPCDSNIRKLDNLKMSIWEENMFYELTKPVTVDNVIKKDLHREEQNKFSQKIAPAGDWTQDLLIILPMLHYLS